MAAMASDGRRPGMGGAAASASFLAFLAAFSLDLGQSLKRCLPPPTPQRQRAMPSTHAVGLPSAPRGTFTGGFLSLSSPALVLAGSATAWSVDMRAERRPSDVPMVERSCWSALSWFGAMRLATRPRLLAGDAVAVLTSSISSQRARPRRMEESRPTAESRLVGGVAVRLMS